MLCLSCHKNKAIKDPMYGYLECKICQTTNSKLNPVEIIPDYIKRERKQGEATGDTIQPFRKGVLSKEFVKKYGTGRLKVSEQEIKKAKNVWDGYYD